MDLNLGKASTSEPQWSFDPFSEGFAQDPYAVFSKLREPDALYFYEEFDIWLASRFSDVSALATNSKMVRSLQGFLSENEIAARLRQDNWHDMPFHSRFVQFSLLDSDGQIHDRLRKQVFKLFTPAAVATLRLQVQQIVDDVLDGLAGRQKIDFIEDLAAHIPSRVIAQILGAPQNDCHHLRRWSEEIVQFFDVDRSDDRKQRAENATEEFYNYLVALKAKKMRSGGDDLMTVLIRSEETGKMSGDELISTCMLILMAGHGSNIDALGNGMHALLKFPGEMTRLRNDLRLMQTAIQEMFRYESPLHFFHRYATEDVEFYGRRYPKGTKFGLLYGSANRDPSNFENADIFDVGRKPNRHLAFGAGSHFCLGNHVSRLNMDVIFTTLFSRYTDIRLLDREPEYKLGLSARGPKHLLVHLHP